MTIPLTVWSKFPATLTVKEILKSLLSTGMFIEISTPTPATTPVSTLALTATSAPVLTPTQQVSETIKVILNEIISSPTYHSPDLSSPLPPTFTSLPIPTLSPPPPPPTTTTTPTPTADTKLSSSIIDSAEAWSILKNPKKHKDKSGQSMEELLDEIGFEKKEDLKVLGKATPKMQKYLSDIMDLLKDGPQEAFKDAMGI